MQFENCSWPYCDIDQIVINYAALVQMQQFDLVTHKMAVWAADLKIGF